jgi:hypothetical protein
VRLRESKRPRAKAAPVVRAAAADTAAERAEERAAKAVEAAQQALQKAQAARTRAARALKVIRGLDRVAWNMRVMATAQTLRNAGRRERVHGQLAAYGRIMQRRAMWQRATRELRAWAAIVTNGNQLVSVTLHLFNFMRQRNSDQPVTVLPAGRRGTAHVRDSQGRYHQQITERTVNVSQRVLERSAIEADQVYWDAAIGDTPAIAWAAPVYSLASIAPIFEIFQSGITALRFTGIIPLPRDEGFDRAAVVNHDSANHAYVYSQYMSAEGRRGAPTLNKWLGLPLQATGTKQRGAPMPSSAGGLWHVTLDSSGKTLYINTQTKQRRWQLPLGGRVVASAAEGLPEAAVMEAFVCREAAQPEPEVDHAREDVQASSACGYDIILAHYQSKVERLQQPRPGRSYNKGGRFKVVVMTYEGVHAICKPGMPYDNANMGLTLEEFRRWFVRMGLGLVVLDVRGERIEEACYEPEFHAKDLYPRTVWVVQHNGHLYDLNSSLKSAEQCLLVSNASLDGVPKLDGAATPDGDDMLKAPSPHYHISDGDGAYTFIATLAGLRNVELKGKVSAN